MKIASLGVMLGKLFAEQLMPFCYSQSSLDLYYLFMGIMMRGLELWMPSAAEHGMNI